MWISPTFGRSCQLTIETGDHLFLYTRRRTISLLHGNAICSRQKLRGLSTYDVADDLNAKFSAFKSEYSAALRGLCDDGLGNVSIREQLTAYTGLLDAICSRAKGDRNRDLLLRPLLQVGVIPIEDGPSAAIVYTLEPAAAGRNAKESSSSGWVDSAPFDC